MARGFQWWQAVLCGGAMCACLAVPSHAGETSPWITRGCAAGTDAGVIAGERAGSAPAQPGSGVVTTMSSGMTPDGTAFFRAVAAELDVSKTVSRTGASVLRLARGDDAVEIRADREGVTVSRGGQSVWVDLGAAGEDDLLAVRTLLAGSRSVRALRVLGATMGSGSMRSPGALAVLLADALVGVLDGDVAAVRRLAEHVGGRGPTVRRASSESGCYEKWEAEAIRAYDSYMECVSVFIGLTQWQDVCGLRWLLWAESAWFSFLMCSGSPVQLQ